MKLGSNIINSQPKQSFIVEFNRENECENVTTINSNNMTKDNLARINDESSILDEVELLDINVMEGSICCSNCIQNESFDSTSLLSEDVSGANFFAPNSPLCQPDNLTSPKYQAGLSAALQYETLKKRAKPLNDNAKDECISAPIVISSSESPKKQTGMIMSGETKNLFGLRSPKISSESRLPKDSDDVIKKNRKHLPLSLPKDEDAPGMADSFFLNKSFDDVISAVSSFSPLRTGDEAMQKSFSRSQENCFSPDGVELSQLKNVPRLGQASGGSMNKLSNVEEVENMARLQADHLRQTVRSCFSSKRLSQSSDRLRQTSNYSLVPDAAKMIPSVSDSDDSLVTKTKVLPKVNHSPDASSMSHPQSLPNIIPQSRILQAKSKLMSPSSNPLTVESKPAFKTSSKISVPNNSLHSQQPQTRIRNVSSTRVPNQKAPDKPNINRSSDGTPPPVQRALGKSSKQVSRLQPPQSHRARIEKSSEGDKNPGMNETIKSGSYDKTGSSIGSTSPSSNSFTDEGSSAKPSSIPISRCNQRFSSIPRPKQTSK